MLGLGTILFTAWRVRQLRKIPLKKCLDFWQKKERIKKGKKEGRKEGRKEGKNRKRPTIHTELFSHLFIEDSLIVLYNILCIPMHIFIGCGKETEELPKSP